jgi:hypothetical protein
VCAWVGESEGARVCGWKKIQIRLERVSQKSALTLGIGG